MNLIGLKDLSKDSILSVVQRSRSLTPPKKGPYLPPNPFKNSMEGMPVALLFFENSTRTRSSFELAVAHLGGYPLALPLEVSSVKKGETPLDTCLNLQAMGVQCFVVRHSDPEVFNQLVDRLETPIVNAGAGNSEHPTQALLDIRTMQDALGCTTFEGKTVAIIGDVAHSRVARSNAIGLQKLGARVRLGGPKELLPQPTDCHGFEGAECFQNRAEVLEGADVVMVLRIQKERFAHFHLDVQRYIADWQMNQKVVEEEMAPGAVIMHPGPVVRGEELTDAVVDGDRSLILTQVRHGVAVRQAVLYSLLCLGEW